MTTDVGATAGGAALCGAGTLLVPGAAVVAAQAVVGPAGRTLAGFELDRVALLPAAPSRACEPSNSFVINVFIS